MLKNTKYETIDNDGNLLFNAIDIEPTKIDARMEDSIKNQYQQNDFFLADSSFDVHPDFKLHSGVCTTLGKGMSWQFVVNLPL